MEDVTRCAELMRKYPNEFILGVRNFNDKSVPFRSRFGNKMTSFIFKFFCGLKISDTQTGLKGIPRRIIPSLMEVRGERFEYASSVLLAVNDMQVRIREFSIQTIYIDENKTSHFDPLLDSIRIYSLILRYLCSSLSAFIVDIVAFSIFLTICKRVLDDDGMYIIISTYLAKLISCTYSYFVNRRLVFRNTDNYRTSVLKYAFLCIIQSTISGVLVDRFVLFTAWNEIICKVIIDVILFFVNFQLQNNWVFKGEKVD